MTGLCDWFLTVSASPRRRRLTLVVQLEQARAPVRRRAVVNGQRVGGAADHLTLHQQRVIGQNQRGTPLVHASDGQLLAVGQVHALHLETQTDRCQ